jgi:ABC-type lipoprotein export system ATPase subunit
LPESTLIVITHRSALAAIADATITIEDAQAQMVRQKNSCVNSGPGNLPSE